MGYKRIGLLIKTYKKVLEEVPDAELHIAGDGPDLVNLKKLASELDVPVKFHGFVTDTKKLELIHDATVFVNPSSQEGWGLTVIEVNACGVPAVAFNVHGLNDSIKNNETGFLVKDENLDEMASRIVEILNDNKLRERLSGNAIKWASNFSWENTVKKTNDLILKVVEK